MSLQHRCDNYRRGQDDLGAISLDQNVNCERDP